MTNEHDQPPPEKSAAGEPRAIEQPESRSTFEGSQASTDASDAKDPTGGAAPAPPLIPAIPAIPAAPVAEGERIRCLDVLRGFALMGVLLMNMQAFAMPFCAYMNPTSYGDASRLGFFLWSANHIFAEGKFITIFSMLFGAGIVLMTSRAEAARGRSAGLHYRRMFWMLLFGAAHGVLIWYGDILMTYALCGLIVYWFRRRRPWLLVSAAIVLMLIPLFFLTQLPTFMSQASESERQEMAQMWSPSAEQIAEQEETYRGSYSVHLAGRIKAWIAMFGFIYIFGWRTLGLMLVGMALYKTGVLTGTRSTALYRVLVVIGFCVGLPLCMYGIHHHQACNWDMGECMGPGSLYNYFGSLLAAFGWIGLIMLACRTQLWPGLQRRLGAVGQMAFTNYIMHSVICTTLFYGHGFGQFGRFDRFGQLCVVVAIAALQMWYSPLWLKHFKFGPLEWLWRSLSYWRFQPWRREVSAG